MATAIARGGSGERIFFSVIAGYVLLAVLFGFGPSYFLRPIYGAPQGYPPLSPVAHIHGALFSLWIGLFCTQIWLVGGGRRDLHRKLGRIGLPLVLAMLFFGALAGIQGVARNSGPPIASAHSWLAVPLFGLVGFVPPFLLALKWRKDPLAHKRLMVLGVCAMLSAAFVRIPIFPGMLGMLVMPDLPAVALAAFDRITLGKVHRATILGSLLALFSQLFPMLIWQTDTWLRIAHFLADR